MTSSVQIPYVDEPTFEDESLHQWARNLKTSVNMLIHAVVDNPHGEMAYEEATDAYVIHAVSEIHLFHMSDLVEDHLNEWTFDPGGAADAITAVAAGTVAGNILVTTTTAHGLEVNDEVSQTGLSDAAYVGVFDVKRVDSTTTYEVVAAFTATDTGFMDHGSSLICDSGAGGDYLVLWSLSAQSAANNVVFDFDIHQNELAHFGTRIRRKFGTAGDFGAMSGQSIVTVTDGDRLTFAFQNITNATDITIRDFNFVVVRI